MMVAYDRISSSAMEFGKLQTWCQWTYFILLNSGVYLIQFRTIHNSRHFDWGVRQIDESTNGVWETSKLDGTGLISLFPIGVFTLFNSELVTTQDISIGGCNKLMNLPMKFGKLQSLVQLHLSQCSQLGCLPDSILNLSQLKTFRLVGCDRLANLPMEFRKFQTLVELNLSKCSQLGCLPHSIVNLSQLKTFLLWGCNKLTNLSMEFGKLQSLVKFHLSHTSQLGCLLDSIVNLSQFKTF